MGLISTTQLASGLRRSARRHESNGDIERSSGKHLWFTPKLHPCSIQDTWKVVDDGHETWMHIQASDKHAKGSVCGRESIPRSARHKSGASCHNRQSAQVSMRNSSEKRKVARTGKLPKQTFLLVEARRSAKTNYTSVTWLLQRLQGLPPWRRARPAGPSAPRRMLSMSPFGIIKRSLVMAPHGGISMESRAEHTGGRPTEVGRVGATMTTDIRADIDKTRPTNSRSPGGSQS